MGRRKVEDTFSERIEKLEASVINLKYDVKERQVKYKRFKKDISTVFFHNVMGIIYLILTIFFGGFIQLFFGLLSAILLGLGISKMLFMVRKIESEK